MSLMSAAVPESVAISAVPERVQVARTFLAGVLGKSHARVDLAWDGSRGEVLPWQVLFGATFPRVKWTAGEVPLAGSFSVGLFPNRACGFPRTLLSSGHFG